MDNKLFQVIVSKSGHFPILDQIMIFLSKKVRYLYLFILIILLFSGRKHRETVRNAAISTLANLFLIRFLKIFCYRPRPFLKQRVGILIPTKFDSSFPSKHTVLAFAISTVLIIRERVLGMLFALLSLLTGFSRIWVGHHYPFDIIFSAILGTSTSLLTEATFLISEILKENTIPREESQFNEGGSVT
ncbi:phosphatase PAP2 family protein [Bacillus litorisediminis]|uniref:phosphatase PAP2 family protein n=1 Tax=Bacillus litorisediminis TaxID=2922713 RepID=UPI001FAEB845|nr:phosphatase PAP2 family protein [Bacillus litorisediminis]